MTDTCTGLMWQKETADVNSDSQIDERGDRIAWFLALAFCEDLTFADYENWRLPNVRELQSIADYGQEVSPSIDPAFSAVGADYWSSTSTGRFPSAAWTVRFVNGDVITAGKPGRNFVRAVRGGP